MGCWTSSYYFGLFQSENRIDLKMKWPLIQKLISNSSNSLKVKPEKARKWISSGFWETCAITQQSSPSLPRSSHPSHAWAYQGGTEKLIFCPQNSSLTIFCYECLQTKLLQIFADKLFPQVTDSLPPCLPHEVHGRVHPLHLVVQHLHQDLLHHLHHDQHLPGLCQIRRDNLIRYGHVQVGASVTENWMKVSRNISE